MQLVVPDLRDGYTTVVQEVMWSGKSVAPRGLKTWEIEDATVVIENPRRLLPVGIGREPNLAIAAAEAVGLCGGLDVTTLCVSVSKTFRRFLDGSVLWGQYGRRTRSQMETVLRRLRQDASTRQAVVQIYDPGYDQVDVRDVPCTLGFGFRIRDDNLHMSVRMRSQDAWLGLAYDAFFMGQLGWTVANALNIEFTRLAFKQDSLHVYARDIEKIDQLHSFTGSHDREPTGFGYLSEGVQYAYESYRERAELVYNKTPIMFPAASESENWYVQVLEPYDRLTRTENFQS